MTNQGMEYRQLDKFVGRWKTTGKIPATDTSPEVKISGTDSYKWLAGGFFLLHKVAVSVGDDKNKTIEIIGFDNLRDQYTMQYYDNKGKSGFMTATLQDGLWTFLGGNLRFKGGFKKGDKEFSGIWEQSPNGESWTHFMDITLRKLPL